MSIAIARLIVTASVGGLWGAPALAYIGPGAGVTLLGALWGVVIAIVLAIGAVVLWPVRHFIRRRRKGTAKSVVDAEAPASKTATSNSGKDAEVETSSPR